VDDEKFKKFINKPSDNGLTAIHYAAFRGNIQIIKNLIECGSNLEFTTKKGLNVLHLAAQGDQSNSLVFFIEKYGFSIESVDKYGSSVLHWACYVGSENIVNYVVDRYKKFIDINKKDNEGLTALHLAVLSG
jgi:palmitoyltransferase